MKHPNVFWISIDSLRRDFLWLYEPSKNTSTYLDELGATGAVFENAFPGGNWTMPSHASMLTGLDATSHMIWSWQHRFPHGITTAFDIFGQAGYTTGCFAFPMLGELFAKLPIDYFGKTDDPALLKCMDSDRPFFLFWHTYDVHYPYGISAPADYDDADADFDHFSRNTNYVRHLINSDRKELILDSYRTRLHAVAQLVRRMAAKLKRSGKFENTYFVITADHGEAWEPFTTFHCNFEQEVMRIPLAITGPRIAPVRLGPAVSQIDLLPTLLSLCGLRGDDADEMFDGGIMPQGFALDDQDQTPVVIAGPAGARNRHRYLAIRNGEWMLITSPEHWQESFHRIGSNGISRDLMGHPLTPDGNKSLEEFRAVAERQTERMLAKRDNVVALSAATAGKLRALGYL
jgi:arylsulfatase A-like enzyme